MARSWLCTLALMALPAATASAQTCIRIDEQQDTLRPEERTAARLLVGKQFALAGHRVAHEGCDATYVLSHIRLGETISVTLSGPLGTREATALGLDDLHAVYSQMVKSLVSGQPVGLAVVDRTNVSAAQDLAPRRVNAEGYWYTRLGSGVMFGEGAQPGAAFGFGYRAGFDRLNLDVSFFNAQLNNEGGYSRPGGSTWSLVKLQGLMYTHPDSNRSAYVGGGLSYGRGEFHTSTPDGGRRNGHGAGLQTDLAGGFEIARAMSMRVFVQADVTLPLYSVEFQNYSYQPPVNGRYTAPVITFERQYMPSVAVSVGFGWQRRGRR